MPAGLGVGEGSEGGTGDVEGVVEDIGSGAEDECEPDGGAKTDQENSSVVKIQYSVHFRPTERFET